jgi:hypothetical protein
VHGDIPAMSFARAWSERVPGGARVQHDDAALAAELDPPRLRELHEFRAREREPQPLVRGDGSVPFDGRQNDVLPDIPHAADIPRGPSPILTAALRFGS